MCAHLGAFVVRHQFANCLFSIIVEWIHKNLTNDLHTEMDLAFVCITLTVRKIVGVLVWLH